MITSDQAKAVLFLSGGLLVAYVAYRMYRVGESAAQSVSETFDNIGETLGKVGDSISVGFRKIVPTTPPDLSELPSSGDYPDAGPIRRGYTEGFEKANEKDTGLGNLADYPMAYNEVGDGWTVAGYLSTFSPEPFDIYPNSRVSADADEVVSA